MLKIINNKTLTEKQFWLDPISTKEQAVQIIRRASRDLIGLCVYQLALISLMVLISGVPWSAFLSLIVSLAVWIGLGILVGRRSYIAAVILTMLTTLPAITIFVVAVYGTVANHEMTAFLSVAFPLCCLVAVSWLAWRALAANRRLRDKVEVAA